MRKAFLIVAIVILVLTPVAAFAILANSPARSEAGFYGYRQELTAQQQADLEESYLQMIDVRKESINKMVQNGLLTEEQGKQALAQLDEMAAYHAENGSVFGYGLMGGCRGGLDADESYNARGRYGSNGGYYGPGMMRGYSWN